MLNKIAKGILAILGALLGIGVSWIIYKTFLRFNIYFLPNTRDVYLYMWRCWFAILVYLLSNKIIDGIVRLTNSIEHRLQEVPTANVISGAFGLIVGLIIACCSLLL